MARPIEDCRSQINSIKLPSPDSSRPRLDVIKLTIVPAVLVNIKCQTEIVKSLPTITLHIPIETQSRFI